MHTERPRSLHLLPFAPCEAYMKPGASQGLERTAIRQAEFAVRGLALTARSRCRLAG